ncbi:MAG: hypothetical protein R6W75_06160 [Smithellaceae bacterium]
MTDYINISQAMTMFITVLWTTIFSFAIRPGIRGFRNLGILGGYVSGFVFIFIAGWQQALFTWILFGVLGGVIYVFWEVFQRAKAPEGEEKPSVSINHIFSGLLAWPIMIPEAIEYILAEIGILSSKVDVGSETK